MLATMSSAYERLIEHQRRTATLASAAGVLGWDQQTYLPPAAAPHRGAQAAALAGMVHEWRVDPRLGEWLAACEETPAENPASQQAVNLRWIRRSYDKAMRLPGELVAEQAEAASSAYDAWKDARARADFTAFQPHLERSLALARREADHLGWETCRYDALLDIYEPGATAAMVSDLFTPLGQELRALLDEVDQSPSEENGVALPAAIPVQEALCREVLAAIGFDFDRGRLDTTTHPFCTGLGPHDVRITTRYHEDDCLDAISGALHEGGHALYEQGLVAEHWGTPMGQTVSLGIHESQSRLWENQVGRSLGFCHFLQALFGKQLPAAAEIDPERLYAHLNRVTPGFIRVESDEISYNLHIILRFELERAMVEGDLAVADLPGAWNDRFRELFGREVPDDARGCLQDVHWTAAFGYFPTYTLGNCYAAQFFTTACQELGDQEAAFARGDFASLCDWLRTAIHRQGSRYLPHELCAAVTGAELDRSHLLAHLRHRYLGQRV